MNEKKRQPSLFDLLKPYKGLVFVLIALTILANGLNLFIPKIIAQGIDTYTNHTLNLSKVAWEFFIVSFFILIFAYAQSIVQSYASEKVARDIRNELAAKISRRTYAELQIETPSKLLTNLTSDMDQVKLFVANAVSSIISSVFLIIGSAILLLLIDWRLALTVLALLSLVAVAFFTIFSRMGPLFRKTQEIIDRLNKTINESILGAALIRVLNSQIPEYNKFFEVNTDAKNTGLSVLRLFASVIPIVTFISNLATLAILSLGGHFVINGTLTIGNFTAFTNYLGILIFPIILIGFMSNVIARAQASYVRVREVLDAPEKKEDGTLDTDIRGDIDAKDVSLFYGGKATLKDVSFSIKAGTQTAIIGPTAAGKTQLLYVLIGLLAPGSGTISYDGKNIEEYKKSTLHNQVGIVFQDSVMFNMTLRENIAFSPTVKNEDLEKAIQTAELQDFIGKLPEGLDTVVSERGTSLSGGQKQRVMLARALSINPKVLFLDDFTAQVDTATEHKILSNVRKNYPNITLVSVTQKIATVEDYDQVILLMEGEILARGTHKELMETSPEYVQIFDSQRSTNAYELRT